MAQSVPPGDIRTQPNAKIVFNAPFDDKHTYHMKMINISSRRIAFGIKTSNIKKLGVNPPCGVLDPYETILLAISCEASDNEEMIRYLNSLSPSALQALLINSEQLPGNNSDLITIEWTNTPDGAAKEFRREWFQSDGMIRRRSLPIEYNP